MQRGDEIARTSNLQVSDASSTDLATVASEHAQIGRSQGLRYFSEKTKLSNFYSIRL
jgi:hypothetical protein